MPASQRFNVLVRGRNDGLVYHGRKCAEKEQRRLEKRSSALRGCVTIIPAA